MKVAHLFWYLCGASSVALIVSTFMTVVPEVELLFMACQGVLVLLAVTFAGMATMFGDGLRQEWIHESRAVGITLSAFAILATFLLFATVG